MDSFTQEIIDRRNTLKRGDFKSIKLEISQMFWHTLPYDYKNRHQYLTDFSIAFLDLYHEKASILHDGYIESLQENLAECYRFTEVQQLRSLNVEDDLSIHSIDFPKSEDHTEWQINYEMDLDDKIFHVYFEGWNFKTIGQTVRAKL
ncbi:MAG: hypothetical protein ACXWCG_02700 [Flavitalea sp.]